ncbi:hypothetical protein T459_28584 [Capsicum annuum]|uniref:ABC transporter family G domain-containing protein n=1 Tax=Capsicum annuum TaxID=4072 RepID=A0A2G2YH95_CAPAN|nr:hypothetical protein T459_28584 [Capsicum annuum]
MILHIVRVGNQRLREARIVGLCLGTLAEVSIETFIPALQFIHYTTGESASVMSSLAYFLAKDMIDHINTIVRPAVYLSMFYFFNNPRSSILDNYLILLCVVYCVTGIAYALAIYFEPGQAQLWSVLLPVVLTLVASKDGVFTAIVGDYIYSKWALEAFIIANAKRTTTTIAIPSVIPQVRLWRGYGDSRGYTNPYPYFVQSLRSIFVIDNFPEKIKLHCCCLASSLDIQGRMPVYSLNHDENVGKPQKVGSLVKIIVYNLDMILAEYVIHSKQM